MGDDEDEEEEPVASQISTREPSSDVSDDDDVEPPPPPPKPAVSTASSAPAAGGAVSAANLGVSLDEFWQDLKDAVQKKSIPTNGQLQAYAFILSFEASEVVIGVRKEMYQRMIEAKAPLIKTAAKELLNREVNVRVKVVEDHEPAAKAPVAASSRPAAREPQSQANAQEDYERAKATQSKPSTDNQNLNSQPQAERPRPAAQPTAALNAPSRVVTSAGTHIDLPEQNLLKEAYKLFEGPGSRLIG